jgi:DNA polymerase-3 subunit alpha
MGESSLMDTLTYAPLHVHTDASLDGFGTVEDLVKDAVKKGMKSLAMTDHGTLANAITFWSLCKKYDVKPILGLEGYIRYDGSNSDRNHLTLLAKNEEGFNNLIKLNNFAHSEGWDGRFPVFTLDELNTYRKGLHVLTGCNSSPLHDSEYEQGMQFVGLLREIVGVENLHAELMFISSFDDYKRSLEAAKRFEIPFVVTNDTHFCKKGTHREQQLVYTSRVAGDGLGYNSIDCYLKTYNELIATGERWVNAETVHEGLFNTLKIAEEVEVWNMLSEPTLPVVEGSEEYIVKELKKACRRDIEINGGKKERIERLQREMKIFRERNLIDYVYILNDIIKYARDNEIVTGPGRGSGSGSYTLYLLGITEADPIHYELLFERFLSTTRADFPDVDVDFESDRRSEVINYAAENWGAIPISTYSRYSHKSAIHDLAKKLAIPKDLEIKAAEAEYGGEEWDAFCDYDKLKIANSAYKAMIGQIRHKSKHAGGIVITDKALPMERTGDEIAAAWSEGQSTRELSSAGIVKYDFLGLTALSQLKEMKEQTGVEFPTRFDDEQVLKAFGEGRVTGIFQWSGSESIRKLTMELYEASGELKFEDLIALNALHRPGPLGAGTAKRYKDFKVSPRKLHPMVDDILAETYGVICYQEQVMNVYAKVSGRGLGEADELRKLFAHGKDGDKGRAEEIAKFEEQFMIGGEAQGIESELLDKIWREIATHSQYSFNKSHSTTYTMISYRMAFYQVYHFASFIRAMMIYDVVNAPVYLMEALERGTEIRAPEVNISTDVVEVRKEDGREVLYLPLCDVAFFGDKGLKTFLEERQKNGLYDTYAEFNRRVPRRACNNRVRKNLERIGAFRTLVGNPKDAIKDYDSIVFNGEQEAQREILGYIIPTRAILDKVEELKAAKVPDRYSRVGSIRYAGIVVKTTEKLTRRGSRMVGYQLSPQDGVTYFGDRKDIPKPGDFISGIKTPRGTMKTFKVLKDIFHE